MQSIKINIPWDNGRLNVEISEVTGTNSIWWNVFIGTGVVGTIYYRFGEWIYEKTRWAEFDYNDGQEMIELVKARYSPKELLKR